MKPITGMKLHRTLPVVPMLLLVAMFLVASLPQPVRAQLAPTNPGIDREKEFEFGREFATWMKRNKPLSRDKAICERVQRIGSALAAKIEPKAYPYEFNVIASPEINAFSISGGFCFFYEGLILRIPDDNALALVIAHEMMHAAHRHLARTENKMILVKILASAASLSARDYDLHMAKRIILLTRLQYGREAEFDADASGLQLAWLAGFETEKAADNLMKFLEWAEGDVDLPNYLRDHPKPKDRLKAMKPVNADLAKRSRPIPVLPAETIQNIPSKDLVGDIGASVPMDSTWFPLGVGRDWLYTVTGAGGQSYYTTRVAAAIPTDKGTLYRLETIIGNKVVTAQVMTTKTEIWRRTQITSPDSPWKLDALFDVPPEGRTVDGYTYSFVGLETIELPCGHFDNVRHLRRTGGASAQTLDYWFAENIGLVKRSCGETGISETLIRYTTPAKTEGGK